MFCDQFWCGCPGLGEGSGGVNLGVSGEAAKAEGDIVGCILSFRANAIGNHRTGRRVLSSNWGHGG